MKAFVAESDDIRVGLLANVLDDVSQTFFKNFNMPDYD
jgi:hypothetical protein